MPRWYVAVQRAAFAVVLFVVSAMVAKVVIEGAIQGVGKSGGVRTSSGTLEQTTAAEYAFGVMVDPATVVLPAEHDALEWLTTEAASARLEWPSNRAALQDLHQELCARLAAGADFRA